MTAGFEPHSEGYFCATCGIHRTRTRDGRCPSCDDIWVREENAKRDEAERKKREAAA